MIHELKTLPEYFDAAQKRLKNFEVRENDRSFAVGDFLALNEWSNDTGYTGRCMLFNVLYILDNPDYCKSGYVVLGTVPLSISDVTPIKGSWESYDTCVYGRNK